MAAPLLLLELALLPHRLAPATPRCAAPTGLAKKTKSSFEPYTIGGKYQLDLGFPLPQRRDAVHVHKKHMPKGASPAKVSPDDLPDGLNAGYPGLRVLHLDPFVAVVDNFFTSEECDAYLALSENERAYQLDQSATFSKNTASGRTSTTYGLCHAPNCK